ncbi:MAG: LysM peptidoglycan-binding domain-containing protein [Flavobacteriaceae bacterium]|nr:MAG: LysM peptidoglycan-binding domain-containing protein [Flavobacteriaceae bacterium]
MKGIKILIAFLVFAIAASCGQQKKYISYTVKKGETMKVIAKRLDMKTRDLLRLNPDVGRKPSPNTIIIIPNKDFIAPPPKDTLKIAQVVLDSLKLNMGELEKEYLTHTVKKGDTYYNLTRRYNVSENTLNKLNPELVTEDLKLGMVLKIKPVEENEIVFYKDTVREGISLKLAMLLPFKAVEFDTIAAKDIFGVNRLANITTDFYLGAEIAIDSLRNQGVAIEVSLFDTGKKNSKIRDIINENDLDENDVIIGPMYSDEAMILASKVRTEAIFPVYSKNQEGFASSGLIKTYADKEVHQKIMLAHIDAVYSNENILIIGDSTATSIKKADEIQSVLLKNDSITEAKIIHATNGFIRKDYIINALKAEVENWVILATHKSAIASDAINSLISLPTEEENGEENEDDNKKEKKKNSNEPEMQILPEDTVVKIFACDKSTTYDKIDNTKLAKLGFTFTSDIFADDTSVAANVFNKKYQEKNHTYPSYYATKGFDITYDILARLASGDDLKETFQKGTSYRLESKFEFSKELFTTSDNNGIFIIQYNPDLTTTRIR